jgi:hypothetical protein
VRQKSLLASLSTKQRSHDGRALRFDRRCLQSRSWIIGGPIPGRRAILSAPKIGGASLSVACRVIWEARV